MEQMSRLERAKYLRGQRRRYKRRLALQVAVSLVGILSTAALALGITYAVERSAEPAAPLSGRLAGSTTPPHTPEEK